VNYSSLSENNKMTINTSNLSDGFYFVEFIKGSIKDARKVIVRH